jgi:hypothetical protein
MTEDNTKAVPLTQPTILPDGTQILSGPVPGGAVAVATQATPRSQISEALQFAGVEGGSFTIYGGGFGSTGMVHVGGTQVTVTSWQSYRIKGLLPPGLNPRQDAVVTDGEGRKTVVPYAGKPAAAASAAATK